MPLSDIGWLGVGHPLSLNKNKTYCRKMLFTYSLTVLSTSVYYSLYSYHCNGNMYLLLKECHSFLWPCADVGAHTLASQEAF